MKNQLRLLLALCLWSVACYSNADAKDGKDPKYRTVPDYLHHIGVPNTRAFVGKEKLEDQYAGKDLSDPVEQAMLEELAFSELSDDTLARVFRAFTETSYPNAWVKGKSGVGKSNLLDQLVLMLSFGIIPQHLRERLNITQPDSPASKLAEYFIGKTNVIFVNDHLLGYGLMPKNGALANEIRLRTAITQLFDVARDEFKHTGKRTVFVFEEAGDISQEVHNAMKPLQDAGGFRMPGSTPYFNTDPGYHVLSLSTPDDFIKVTRGDGQLLRRYSAVIDYPEPSEKDIIKVVRTKVDNVISPNHAGIQIEDEAIELVVKMRHFLSWPPEAGPGSALKGTDALASWKMQHPGEDAYLVTKADAQRFIINNAQLTDAWISDDGPIFADLAARVKEMVIGHDEVIDKICQRIQSWARIGFGGKPPVFFLGGKTGSGKDSIVAALNTIMFGEPMHELVTSLAGKDGYYLESLVEGPPLGNHSDHRPPTLERLLNEKNGRGLILLDEAQDLPSAEFDKLKVFVERAAIVPSGTDTRERPIRFPIFIVGQFGEEFFDSLDGKNVEAAYRNLSQSDIEELFRTGYVKNGRSYGQVPQALLDRASASGGIYLIKPNPPEHMPKIADLKIRTNIANVNHRLQTQISVDPRLGEILGNYVASNNIQTRVLAGYALKIIENSLSRATEHRLSLQAIRQIRVGEDHGMGTEIYVSTDTRELRLGILSDFTSDQAGCLEEFGAGVFSVEDNR